MNNDRVRRRLMAGIALLVPALFGSAQAQVNVTTFHNDNSRSGLNSHEILLTPANVNSQQFGKLFTVNVDGFVYAQPLYMSGINISGGTHNVVYVATENDSVYAIDADTGTTYNRSNLIPAGGTVGSYPCADITPSYGITGTPVIDSSTNTLYVVTNVVVAGGNAQFLHALDLSTLAEKFGGPVSIDASVPGVASDGNGSTVTFDAYQTLQRAGLLLQNGHVVIGWSPHCDIYPYHGWIMSYSASSLQQEAVLNLSPNTGYGGIWMSGGGIAADASGNMYVATANGTFDGKTEWGDSILKLGQPSAGQLPILDSYTPWNQDYLNAHDLDLGSGAVMLLPLLPSGRQLLTQQGKFGSLVLLDLSNLGGYCINKTPACSGSDNNVYQQITAGPSLSGIWGAPAYWNGNVYYAQNKSGIKAYSFNASGSGLLSTTATSQTAQAFTYFNPTPAVSANGNSNAIVWAVDGSSGNSSCTATATCLGLFAWDATNLSTLLYNSNQTANGATGPSVKFATPTIANGKVYVGTQTSLLVYGLTSGMQTAATPSFSPQPGTFSSAQPVLLSDSTPNAVIHYTIDGSTPGTGSPQYTQAIQVNATTTIQTLAVAAGYTNSPIASATYTINAGTGGGAGGGQVGVGLTPSANVTALAASGNAVPNGGIDGGGYAMASNLLGTSLSWSGSVFAFGAAGSSDAVWGKSVALPAGQYSTLKLLGTAVNGNQLNQAFVVTYTDGTTSTFTQSLSDWFYPQSYAGETLVLTMAYRLNANGAAADGPVHLYGYSLALNAAKTVSSIMLPNNRNVLTLAIDLVPVTGAGTTPSAATPAFSPQPGTFTGAQTVQLSDSTPGAVIYYTTNGTAPGTGSAQYSQPISISATSTLQAIAVASGYNNSSVANGVYTINTGSTGGGTTPVSISLTSAANLIGIVANGGTITTGGIDGGNFAYSSALTGSSLTWSGSTFSFGTPGTLNAVAASTVALPAGQYSALQVLGAGVDGNQTAQTFVVTYTDGTSSRFTQSMSDWFTPQGYSNESTVLTMAYRLNANGTAGNGPCQLYGYSFVLNGTKSVASVTLPGNAHAVILAIDLVPVSGGGGSLPTAATPGFAPQPAAFTAPQTVQLSDGTPGAVIYYTTNGTTPGTGSAQYSQPISVSATTTLQAIAVASGYSNSAVASGTYTINVGTGGGSSPVSVGLSGSANVVGIVANGSAVPGGGIDGGTYAFSSTLMGASLTWSGSSFTFGSAGVTDAVWGTTIVLPTGQYSSLKLLGTGVNGSQANQTFVVTYSDGTSSSFSQSMSDWFYPQGYSGETTALTMAYRLNINGTAGSGPCNLYGYVFGLNATKSVISITLPNNRNAVIFAIDLSP